MSLGTPIALLGLLALPLVWWLHKKLSKPPEVVLPSLMFLQDEDDASKLPRGRRFDAELLLALAATTLLVFAAAGPELRQSAPRRVVRVVVSGGGPAQMSGYAAAAREAQAQIRAALDEDDDVQVLWVPAVENRFAPRPTDERLLSEALAGDASARFVISDRAPSAELGPVQWIAIGSSERSNTGIVGVSLRQTAAGAELFCTVAHHGPAPARGQVGLHPEGALGRWEAQPLALAPGSVATYRFPLDGAEGSALTLSLTNPTGELHDDDLQADDDVHLAAHALGVYLDARLPETLRRRIEAALRAAVGSTGYRLMTSPGGERVDLAFVARGAGRPAPRPGQWVLTFQHVAEGAAAERAPAGADGQGREPLVHDLSTAGVDWVYAEGAAVVRAGERVLLARQAGGRAWPVVLVEERVVRFAPDPLRGDARAVDAPFWPLFLENFVVAARGAGVGLGYRAVGLLDPASSKPGDARIPFDPASIAQAQPSVPGRSRPLRPLLIACALACLGLLWAAPRIRRRLTARPALTAGRLGRRGA